MALTLQDLISIKDPAGPLLRQWIDAGRVDVQVLDIDQARRDRCLVGLQVGLHSLLGALAYETGGLLVDHGWLRLLGGGHGVLPSLYEAFAQDDASSGPGYIVLGWDVVGGVFALDGGVLRGVKGHVCYFAPDALQWEDLGFGHAEFVHWTLSGGLSVFACDLRWEGWERQAKLIPLDGVFTSEPALWAPEGQQADAPKFSLVRLNDWLAEASMATAVSEQKGLD